MTTQKTPEAIANEIVEEACKKHWLYKPDMDQVCVEALIADAIKAERERKIIGDEK